jgi:hypothetical protein
MGDLKDFTRMLSKDCQFPLPLSIKSFKIENFKAVTSFFQRSQLMKSWERFLLKVGSIKLMKTVFLESVIKLFLLTLLRHQFLRNQYGLKRSIIMMSYVGFLILSLKSFPL